MLLFLNSFMLSFLSVQDITIFHDVNIINLEGLDVIIFKCMGCYHFSWCTLYAIIFEAFGDIFLLKSANVIILGCLSFMLSFLVLSFILFCHLMLSFFMLSFDVFIWCYHLMLSFGVIIYFMLSFDVIISQLSFLCYHFSLGVIIYVII